MASSGSHCAATGLDAAADFWIEDVTEVLRATMDLASFLSTLASEVAETGGLQAEEVANIGESIVHHVHF